MTSHHAASPSGPSSSLIRAVQSGRDGWERFVSVCAPAINAWLRRHGLQAADAEDILADVLCTLARQIHSYQPGRPFIPWLLAVVRSRFYDAQRRRGRHPAGQGGTDFLAVVQA